MGTPGRYTKTILFIISNVLEQNFRGIQTRIVKDEWKHNDHHHQSLPDYKKCPLF